MSRSGASTPRNFQGSVSAAEDLFKAQTVGLVNLDDFRKRRRDVESNSGPGTPATDGSDADDHKSLRKKKRKAGRKLLSFDDDDDNDDDADAQPQQAPNGTRPTSQADVPRKVKPNPDANIPAPKAITKATQAAEAAERERLKEQYLKDQERVRNSEICIPFVFYDGSNIPGGSVKIKKGDHVWLFLERCRKVGAEMGVSGGGNFEGGSSSSRKGEGRKSWARIGVDDLLLVRGGLIIPHHYDFHYFIVNKIPDPSQPGQLLFNYSSTAANADDPGQQKLLRTPNNEKVEGQDDDAVYTKVVDRRWYQKNKHIYPASLWRAYEPGQEFEELKKGRKDAQGNAFFFS